MPYADGGRSFTRLGVVGSGQIGPDIALHLAKVLHQHGALVVVVDVAEAALEAGRKKLERKIDRGVETGAFTPEQAAAMKTGVRFTSDYSALDGAGFVIEAASEDLGLKRRIFAELERRAGPGAVLASNSSHLEPERIFAELGDPSRALVIHYFFPAERNPLVELVPAAATDDDLVAWLLRFYERIGKVPLRIGSRYGYAIDPIFEGLFQAAALAVEEGLGSVREVDDVARRALGLGVGPFTAMNLTGGNPITAHGLDELHERVHPWFRTPQLMKDAMRSGEPWPVAKRGDTVELEAGRETAIRDRMEGSFFGLVGEVLDSGIASLADLELGVEVGLAVRAPFAFMNERGPARALELVRAVRRAQPDFFEPRCLVAQAARNAPWRVPCVLRRDHGRVAVLTIRRPQVLNALNAEVQLQLGAHLGEIAGDAAVDAVVLTGFGRKAFVSGADVGMLTGIDSPEAGAATSAASHELMNRIEGFEKPVVCAYNGLAFGGGNELGMACHARLAPKGLAILAAQPEPNLGIIPGAGATQRLPRLVGVERAWPLLRTGRPVSSREAREIGLIRDEVEGDLLEAAIALARDAASGAVELPRLPRDPIAVPEALPQVDIGHRSKAVDALLRKTILDGARLPLREALALEVQRFGEVCGLEDMRIGVRNFVENGPRSKAPFVHR